MEKTAKLKIIDDVKLEPTLKEAQAFVGGYVEGISMPNGDYLIVNEEGKLKGLPFNEQAAGIRNDINLLAQTILRQISQDSRFTNEDRQYIQEITGKEAMDKLQSYDQVFLSLQKTQLLLEDRLTETSGAIGVKPSHSMSIQELYDSYNNFKLDNKMTVKEGTVRRNDLPSYNLEQVKRRLKAYHTDFYNALYNPDGSSKPQDEVNKNLEQLGFGQ